MLTYQIDTNIETKFIPNYQTHLSTKYQSIKLKVQSTKVSHYKIQADPRPELPEPELSAAVIGVPELSQICNPQLGLTGGGGSLGDLATAMETNSAQARSVKSGCVTKL